MITPTTEPPLNTHLLTNLCMNLEEKHFRSKPMPDNYPRKRHLSNYVSCNLNWLIFSQNTILLKKKKKKICGQTTFFFRLGMWHFIKNELSEPVTSSKILIVKQTSWRFQVDFGEVIPTTVSLTASSYIRTAF